MAKINEQQLGSLLQYRDCVNKVGSEIPENAAVLLRKLHEIRTYRFLLGLLMGTELLKIELRALIVLEDYIKELKWLIETNGTHPINNLRDYQSESFGKMADEFCSRFDIEKSDKILYDDIWKLNRKRNEIAHDVISVYKGDIEKADEAIKSYVLTQPVDNMLKKLVTLLNNRREENGVLEVKIRSMGLL